MLELNKILLSKLKDKAKVSLVDTEQKLQIEIRPLDKNQSEESLANSLRGKIKSQMNDKRFEKKSKYINVQNLEEADYYCLSFKEKEKVFRFENQYNLDYIINLYENNCLTISCEDLKQDSNLVFLCQTNPCLAKKIMNLVHTSAKSFDDIDSIDIFVKIETVDMLISSYIESCFEKNSVLVLEEILYKIHEERSESKRIDRLLEDTLIKKIKESDGNETDEIFELLNRTDIKIQKLKSHTLSALLKLESIFNDLESQNSRRKKKTLITNVITTLVSTLNLSPTGHLIWGVGRILYDLTQNNVEVNEDSRREITSDLTKIVDGFTSTENYLKDLRNKIYILIFNQNKRKIEQQKETIKVFCEQNEKNKNHIVKIRNLLKILEEHDENDKNNKDSDIVVNLENLANEIETIVLELNNQISALSEQLLKYACEDNKLNNRKKRNEEEDKSQQSQEKNIKEESEKTIENSFIANGFTAFKNLMKKLLTLTRKFFHSIRIFFIKEEV